MTAKYVQCRYLRRNGEQCSAEAVDDSPDAHVLICAKHLARALQLVEEHRTRSALTRAFAATGRKTA